MNHLHRTRADALDVIVGTYAPMIIHWHYIGGISRLEAEPNASEKHHLIANAANKYWELIDD